LEQAAFNQLTYKVYYETAYNESLEYVKTILLEDSYKKTSLNLQEASSVLKRKLDAFTLKREEGALKADLYTEALFRRFNNFHHRYTTDPPIDKFISKDWSELKEEFKSIDHVKPEHFHFDEEETIKLLAEWRSCFDMLEKLQTMGNAIDTEDVLFKLKLELTNAESILKGINPLIEEEELNVDELSTKQQTLLLNYMLNTFKDKFYNQSARIRFIQKIIRKDYTKIKRVVANPFECKDETYLIKDLMIVRNEFVKLEMQGLADKVKQDIDSID
jgi:hypothetical protein